MVFSPDPILKEAIKFFSEQKVKSGNTGLYHDAKSNRLFVNIFVASALEPRHHKFRFNGPAMKDWIRDFIKRPIVLHKKGDHFDHPTIANASREINEKFQELKKVGELLDLFNPNTDYTYRGAGEILEPKVKDFLIKLDTDQVPMFSSPSVAYTGEDHDIRKGIPMHIALTDDPAFDPEISRISSICEGDENACVQKLVNASMGNYEAGENGHYCFGDAIRDLVFNAAAQDNNTSLKISTFSNNLSKMENKDSDQKTETKTEDKDQDNKSVAEITEKIIHDKAEVAVNNMIKDFKDKLANPEKADPKKTMDNAYSGNSEENKDENKTSEPEESEEVKALKQQVAEMALRERKSEIAKRIPVAMVTDLKSGGVSEKLLNEVVEYWVGVKDKTPEQIGEFLQKQAEQVQTVVSANIPKNAKASNITDDDIASKMANASFDAPDVENNREKIANASNTKDAQWQFEFSSMLVSQPTKTEGKGSPRRMID